MVYRGCVVWSDLWCFLIGIRHRNIYVQEPESHKAYIYVANHISYLDSAILPKVFRRPIRPLGKAEMARIPIFGTIYKNAIVTVDRSSTAARAQSIQVLKSILEKEISVLVFPEGTFNTTRGPLKEFYDGAFRIAIESGTPIKPVLLLDTFSRMHYKSIFTINPGRSRAVFLPEVSVEGLTADDVAALREKVYGMMEKELLARGAAWVEGKV